MQHSKNRFLRRGTLLLVLFMGIVLFPKQSLSAPSITSVSGTINEGQAVTITGSGFGVKNPAAPYIWANFDDGSPQPSALGQIRSWSVLNFTPTTGVGVRGTVGLQSHLWTLGGPNDNFSALVGNKPSGFSWGDYNQTWYVFRKSKRNFAVTDDMNWKNLRFWYANGSLYTQLGNGNISEEGLGLASWMCGWHSPPTAGCKDGISIEQIRGYSDGRWNTEQFIARAQSGAGREDGSFEYVVNGRKAAVVPYFDYNQKVFAMAQGAPGDAWYVHDQSANDPDPPSGSRTWADNIYVDRTWARVMLSNRSTWGTASTGPLYEIQIPTAWSASNITIQVNRGELTNGTVYLYVIDSNNSANATGYPVTLADGGGDTTPPTSPTNLAATSPSQSSISVSWTASTDAVGVTGYIVERCQGSGCSNFTQVGTPTASPFVDSGLTANTFYNYHVRATDAAGNLSGWSNVVGATTRSTVQAPCNTVTTTNFSQAAYNSYGAPFDAFQTSTNLMNTTCTSADTHTINLTTGVTGDTTRIIYTKGYWYDAVTAAWRQYTGTCTGALNGEWCQGSVSATITDPNISTASAANPTYLVGMTCSVQGGSWKCGCRDTSCTNFSWQIQGAGM